jgi:hypothetical protein
VARLFARGAREALRGRTRYCEALDEVLTTVQGGLGAVLVLRGEAGGGRTALLDYLITWTLQLHDVRSVVVRPFVVQVRGARCRDGSPGDDRTVTAGTPARSYV